MDGKTVDFLFEAGMLKNTPRSGWLTIGIRRPESVADHSFRSALVGWILAMMEGADENKVVKMCLLHDLEESRLGDLHTVNKAYLEERGDARADVLKGVFCGKEMAELLSEFRAGKTREAILARDADKLEMVLQAKEYKDEGKGYTQDWVKSGVGKLRSKSAKRLAKLALSKDSRDWLIGIKTE